MFSTEDKTNGIILFISTTLVCYGVFCIIEPKWNILFDKKGKFSNVKNLILSLIISSIFTIIIVTISIQADNRLMQN